MISINLLAIPKRINKINNLIRRKRRTGSAESFQTDNCDYQKQENKRRISLQRLKRMRVANLPISSNVDLPSTTHEDTKSITSYGNVLRTVSSLGKARLSPQSQPQPTVPKAVDANGLISSHHQFGYLEKKYTKAELKEYHQLFKLFDTDNSGAIGNDELKEAMTSIGIKVNTSDVNELIKEVDEDGNGEIDFEEFCHCMKKSQSRKTTAEEIVKQCFEVFDQDANGLITENEFLYVAEEVGGFSEELAKYVFGELASTGHISIEQFGAIVEDYLFSDSNSRSS